MPQYFLASFKPTDPSVRKEKCKIDFHDQHHGGYLGFPIGTILAIFICKLPRYFLLSSESNGLSVLEKKRKIDFKFAAILDFQSEQFWLFLIYKSPICFLTSFELTGLAVWEEEF